MIKPIFKTKKLKHFPSEETQYGYNGWMNSNPHIWFCETALTDLFKITVKDSIKILVYDKNPKSNMAIPIFISQQSRYIWWGKSKYHIDNFFSPSVDNKIIKLFGTKDKEFQIWVEVEIC